jgi:hypothetical protein
LESAFFVELTHNQKEVENELDSGIAGLCSRHDLCFGDVCWNFQSVVLTMLWNSQGGKIMKKRVPQIGDGLQGDEWRWAESLEESDGFKDSGFPGCQFRVKLPSHDVKVAVNISTTGKPKWNGHLWQSRCKIEFVGDCEPSTFSGGLLYHKEV